MSYDNDLTNFRTAVVYGEDCPFCLKKRGQPCVSRSDSVGECTLNAPHTSRIQKHLKRTAYGAKKRVQVHFTERETEYADRGTGLVVDRRGFLYPGHDPQDGTNQGYSFGIETGFGNDDRLMEDALDAEECKFCAAKGVSCDYHAQQEDKIADELAHSIVNAIECRYCGSEKGAPCLVWNHKKDKDRLYPHAIRYSDYHELKRQYIASTWKGTCTSTDCPTGPDCTDMCMVRAGFKHIKDNYAHPQQVLNSFYDIEERFGSLEPGTYAAHPVGIYEGDGKMIVKGTITGRINRSEPERQELPVVSRKEVLTRAAEKALEDLQQYAIFGDDDYEDETALMVRFRHTPDAEMIYSYVAVKLEGKWYVTGYQNEGPKTWDRLVELFLSHGEVVDIWINSGWEQIIE